jgi:FkbM family methyltransferase
MFPFLLRFQSPRTYIQVGAWLGDDTLIRACRAYGHRLYLFEPNPARVEELLLKTRDAATIHVVPKAVSNYNGSATFHIACHDDCSSLQEFHPNANQNWIHEWHPYKRFDMVDQVPVDVVRLDSFLDANGIEVVERLEIDAQGEDLRVAESLGARIRDVKNIQIEVNIHDAPLYRDSFTRDDALAFFEGRGFERHISWKQCLNREENIIFRNRRFYPNPVVNRISAIGEQYARSLHAAALKLPRVLSVTRMKLLGQKA